MKIKEKEFAIKLRKEGKTYTQILQQVKVSKSSLSLWLRSYGLSERQHQKMTLKKLKAIQKGHEKWRKMRKERARIASENARAEISVISKQTLHIIGVVLYWAEGAKEKPYKSGQQVYFSNSDPFMIKLFIKWLYESVEVAKDRIKIDIYLHENHKNRVEEVKQYWSQVTGFSINSFGKIYFKRNKINTIRKNVGTTYYGLVRVRVAQSSDLNRQIAGWTKGIIERCEIV